MDMTRAITGLLGCWMRDIHTTVQLPHGLFQWRLHLLKTLVQQLAAYPTDRWFEALPAQGKARGYYQGIVLPLQRSQGWDDLRTLALLKADIRKLQARWTSRLWADLRVEGVPARLIATWEQTLFDLEVAQLFGSGFGYVSPLLDDDSLLYFAFVEDVEKVPAGQRLYAASGMPIELQLNGRELEHVRFSAILVDRFLSLSLQVDPVDPDSVGPEQRASRKEQLQRTLDGVALPVVDFFIYPNAKDALGIAPAFGDWCLLGFTASLDEEEFHIYVTDTDSDESPSTRRTGLSLLTLPSEFWENRLRDVFSLVHIPDADFNENERDDGNPLPTPPIAPIIQESDELDDELRERAERSAMYRSAG